MGPARRAVAALVVAADMTQQCSCGRGAYEPSSCHRCGAAVAGRRVAAAAQGGGAVGVVQRRPQQRVAAAGVCAAWVPLTQPCAHHAATRCACARGGSAGAGAGCAGLAAWRAATAEGFMAAAAAAGKCRELQRLLPRRRPLTRVVRCSTTRQAAVRGCQRPQPAVEEGPHAAGLRASEAASQAPLSKGKGGAVHR